MSVRSKVARKHNFFTTREPTVSPRYIFIKYIKKKKKKKGGREIITHVKKEEKEKEKKKKLRTVYFIIFERQPL